jgi:hypothetical protein
VWQAETVRLIPAAKRIVDAFLAKEYHRGMTAAELYDRYTSFGSDPFIRSEEGKRPGFSAWGYAKQRSKEICR